MESSQQEQRLKIELPISPPSDLRPLQSSTHDVSAFDDDESGLNLVNYPLEEENSSTTQRMMRQYGFDAVSRTDMYTDDASQMDNYTVATSNDAGTTTLETSTVGGPSSFPDLSYNQFETPLQSVTSHTHTTNHTNHTNHKQQQQQQLHANPNPNIRGHSHHDAHVHSHQSHAHNGYGELTFDPGHIHKRRSHSAMLTVADTNSVRSLSCNDKPPTTTTSFHPLGLNSSKQSQQQHQHVQTRVPVINRPKSSSNLSTTQPPQQPPPHQQHVQHSNDRSALSTRDGTVLYNRLIHPRRLSLSVSSITSETSYSRNPSRHYYANLYNQQQLAQHHQHQHQHQRANSQDTIDSRELDRESVTKTFGGGHMLDHSVVLRNISRIAPHSVTNAKIKQQQQQQHPLRHNVVSKRHQQQSDSRTTTASVTDMTGTTTEKGAETPPTEDVQQQQQHALTLDCAEHLLSRDQQHRKHKTGVNSQLAPLLDAYEPFSGSRTSTATRTTPSGDGAAAGMVIQTQPHSRQQPHGHGHGPNQSVLELLRLHALNHKLSSSSSNSSDDDSEQSHDEDSDDDDDDDDVKSGDDDGNDDDDDDGDASSTHSHEDMTVTDAITEFTESTDYSAMRQHAYMDSVYDPVQLQTSIDEFFSVIDGAGMGWVTFDILKICLKLLGIHLSAYQLDILLNELTGYKPSMPISKEMMREFVSSASSSADRPHKKKRKDKDSLQVAVIRTELIVGLLSNLQTTFANTKPTSVSTKRSNKSKSKKSSNKSKSKRVREGDGGDHRDHGQSKPKSKSKTRSKSKSKSKSKTKSERSKEENKSKSSKKENKSKTSSSSSHSSKRKKKKTENASKKVRRSFMCNQQQSQTMQQYLHLHQLNELNQYPQQSLRSTQQQKQQQLLQQSHTSMMEVDMKLPYDTTQPPMPHPLPQHDAPYIVDKSRRKKGHNRFHSDGNLIGPGSGSSGSSGASDTDTNPSVPSTQQRKPPQICRRASPQTLTKANVNGNGNASSAATMQQHVGVRAKHKLMKQKSSPQPPKLLPLAPQSSQLPPLPATPLSHKRHSTPRNMTPRNTHNNDINDEYAQWLAVCFKNSIIDSLLELLHNDELRVYVFDDTMIAHHMIGNDVLSAIEYLFECQFAFMSNGSAYLDFNGFAGGMRKCNIHFETPEVAIPLIFEQLVGVNSASKKNGKKKSKVEYSHLFISEDTFVAWMMHFIRAHMDATDSHQFDERAEKLLHVLQTIYTQPKKATKRGKSADPTSRSHTNAHANANVSAVDKVVNPFEIESVYDSSASVSQATAPSFQNLNLPPKPRHNEYHQHAPHATKHSMYTYTNHKYYQPSMQSLQAPQSAVSKSRHGSRAQTEMRQHKTQEEYYTEY